MVEYFVEKGEIDSDNMYYGLYRSIYGNHTEMAKYFLEKGAKFQDNNDKILLLARCAINKNLFLAQCIMQSGVNIMYPTGALNELMQHIRIHSKDVDEYQDVINYLVDNGAEKM